MRADRQQNIVALRELLAGKFPGLRQTAAPAEAEGLSCWPTGLAHIDLALQGGLPRSTLTEIVAPHPGCGSALLLHHLVRQAAGTRQLTALIDAQDSFDPTALDADTLSRLLWVRCGDASQALQAADLVLRDRNLSLVLVDLTLSPAAQLRRIPSSTWFRMQRILERTATVAIVFSPVALVGGASVRLSLHEPFGMDALEQDRVALLSQLKFVLSQKRGDAAAGRDDLASKVG